MAQAMTRTRRSGSLRAASLFRTAASALAGMALVLSCANCGGAGSLPSAVTRTETARKAASVALGMTKGGAELRLPPIAGAVESPESFEIVFAAKPGRLEPGPNGLYRVVVTDSDAFVQHVAVGDRDVKTERGRTSREAADFAWTTLAQILLAEAPPGHAQDQHQTMYGIGAPCMGLWMVPGLRDGRETAVAYYGSLTLRGSTRVLEETRAEAASRFLLGWLREVPLATARIEDERPWMRAALVGLFGSRGAVLPIHECDFLIGSVATTLGECGDSADAQLLSRLLRELAPTESWADVALASEIDQAVRRVRARVGD